jgi:hypothetical protein
MKLVSITEYDVLREKLDKGVAIANRREKFSDISSKIAKIAYMPILKQKNFNPFKSIVSREVFKPIIQLGGFGEFGDFISRMKSGEMLPDVLFGWSTKTILAILLVLMVLKLKSLKRG